MTIEYVAFDGKRFQNETECEFYEWKCGHTLLNRIELYDKNNNHISDYFSESAYNKVEKIIVPDEPSLNQFKELIDFTGFCSYEDITSIGTWIWDGDKFIKEEINNEEQANKNS